MKILKKGGIVEKRGKEETKSMPHAPVVVSTKFDVYVFIGWFIVFNATVNNISAISWRSVLLVEETGVPGVNHRPVASYWQTLSHNVVSSTLRHERDL